MYLGCSVVIASRKTERLQTAAQTMRSRISGAGSSDSDEDASVPKLNVMKCNIREEQEVRQLFGNTLQEFGRIDFLVNNAGGQFLSPAASISHKGWTAVIDTNLTGTFLCCREVYNQWMQDNGGAIVNIIADMYKGFPSMSHTGAARAGVDNLTKSLSIEWEESGTCVNAVAPGSAIYSETAAANYGDMAVNIFLQVKETLPTRRLGTVEEISAAVCFLLSPAAAFIWGETVYVDGGGRLYQIMWHVPGGQCSCTEVLGMSHKPTCLLDLPDHSNSKAYKWKDDISESSPQTNDAKSKL